MKDRTFLKALAAPLDIHSETVSYRNCALILQLEKQKHGLFLFYFFLFLRKNLSHYSITEENTLNLLLDMKMQGTFNSSDKKFNAVYSCRLRKHDNIS